MSCVCVCFFLLIFEKQEKLYSSPIALNFFLEKGRVSQPSPHQPPPDQPDNRPKTFDELRHIQNSVPRGVKGPEGPPMSRWPRRVGRMGWDGFAWASWEAKGESNG